MSMPRVMLAMHPRASRPTIVSFFPRRDRVLDAYMLLAVVNLADSRELATNLDDRVPRIVCIFKRSRHSADTLGKQI